MTYNTEDEIIEKLNKEEMENKNIINIKKMIEEIGEIIIQKNHDYGSASFVLGKKGTFVHLFDKIKRLESLIWKELDPKVNESIIDTYKDIIGYSIIGLCICKIEKESGSLQECMDLLNNVKLVMENNNNNKN